jgi:hypothetical protein
MKTYNIICKKYINKSEEEDNWPKRYRAEFIWEGTMDYNDLDMGTIFVGEQALDKMNPTFISKPVINEVHQDLTPEQAYKLNNEQAEAIADGIVYEVGKLANGRYYADMIIWEQETQENIDNNDYKVSCAYISQKAAPGGKHNGESYDEEVLDGVYTHMAIVNNPRYEEVTIYELPVQYMNSKKMAEAYKILKNYKGDKMDKFKIVKHLFNAKKKTVSNEAPPEGAKPEEEEALNMEGAMIEVDGQKIPLEDAVAAYKAMNENAEEEVQMLSPGDSVDIDGEKVNVSDLVAAYESSKANAEEEDKPEEEEKTNAEEEEKPEEEKKNVENSKSLETPEEKKTEKKTEEKKPGKHFNVLENAASKAGEVKVDISTSDKRFQRGVDRYGSKKGGTK